MTMGYEMPNADTFDFDDPNLICPGLLQSFVTQGTCCTEDSMTLGCEMCADTLDFGTPNSVLSWIAVDSKADRPGISCSAGAMAPD